MIEAKFKLTEETINVNGKTLYRIEALKDFGDVKKGDKGGFVENEKNLSQRGDCWVYENAKVYGNAEVYDDAKVYGNAWVFDNAKVSDRAEVFGIAEVCGDAVVYCDVEVFGNAQVYDNAKVSGNTQVCGNAKVYGNAKVFEDAEVFGIAEVCGNAEIRGDVEIRGDAVITNKSDYILFKNWWSSGRHFTWTKSNNMWKVGCFYGTGEQLIEKAYKDSEKSGREYERVVKYVESILKDNNADV